MDAFAPSLATIRPDAPEEIPVLDLGAFLAGQDGAREKLATELRHALEHVGFYFVINHGIGQALIDEAFEAARRFHAQPVKDKLALRLNDKNLGYLPMKGSTTRHSQLNANNKPNLVEAFFATRDPAEGQVGETEGPNQWPPNVPGFREAVVAYSEALSRLGHSLLPLYALALDLAPDWFDQAFRNPTYTLRLSHYPQQDAPAENEFGLAPHSDTSFMTLLAQNRVAGLSVRLPNGNWLDAPSLPGSVLVNGGDLLRRWTNERFLATPHRVINRSGQERYAVPFFFDCGRDWTMECLPTCRNDGNPPQYEPITYDAYMVWFRNLNYAAARQKDGVQLSAG